MLLGSARRLMLGLAAALALVLGMPVQAGAAQEDSPVVIIGFSGISWQDVTPQTAPNLYEFGANGAVANIVVRTIDETTCPAEGWMTISAGQRAIDAGAGCRTVQPEVTDAVRELNGASRYGANVGTLGRALAGSRTLAVGPGAAVALTDASDMSYVPLSPIPGSVEGSQAGAKDPDVDAAAQAYRQGGGAASVSVVDLGAVREPDWQLTAGGSSSAGARERWRGFFVPEGRTPDEVTSQVAAVDERFGRLVESIRETTPNATIIVTSVGDSGGARPHLGYFAAQGPDLGADGPLMVSSAATRQRGLVQNTDIMPTVLRWASPGSSAAKQAIGSPLTAAPAGDGEANIAGLVGDQIRSQTVRSLSGSFFVVFGVLFVCVAVMFALRSRWRSGPPGEGAVQAGESMNQAGELADRAAKPAGQAGESAGRASKPANQTSEPAGRASGSEHQASESANETNEPANRTGRPTRRVGGRTGRRPATLPRPAGARATGRRFFLQIAALTSAVPIATLLVNIVPWWRFGNPTGALFALLVTIAALIASVALARFWKDQVFAPMGVVAAVTAVTLTLDVLLDGLSEGHSSLQLSAFFGTQPLVGWRFYGFSNSAFAMFTAGLILGLAWAGEALVARGRRAVALGLIFSVSLAAVLLDGLARFGADFGGPPVLIVGLGALALMVARIALTWWRLGLLLVSAVVVSLLFAALDYMQPASQRSHLGQFIDAIVNGRGVDVVTRKLAQAFGNLPWAMIGALTAAGIIGAVVIRWLDSRGKLEAVKLSRRSRAWRDLPALRHSVIALTLALAVGMLLNDSGLLVPILGLAMALPLWWIAIVRYEDEAGPGKPGEAGPEGEPKKTGEAGPEGESKKAGEPEKVNEAGG